MNTGSQIKGEQNLAVIKWLTFLMFMMFAMTTDAVGVIIPEVMKQFQVSMTAAGLMHYTPMIAIALAGVFLGFLADKLGRKVTVILGLAIFAVNSYLYIAANTFGFILSLMAIGGLAIGVFKTGALALIGDISKSTRDHTSMMNAVEGFFAVGAIIGPFIVTNFLSKGVAWQFLYVVAGTLCVILIILALLVEYPKTIKTTEEAVNLKAALSMLKDPYALGFSIGAFLYVAVECAVYVWMPTLISKYEGNLVLIATYALTIFFVLRAGGRFFGAWLLVHFNWSVVLVIFSFLILLCFLGSVIGGIEMAVVLLPLSGLFMSVIYPTINSKGISCFPKAQHGAIAGVILFFTAAGAALGPLSMGAVSDACGHDAYYGFILATIFAGLLFVGLILNLLLDPTYQRLSELELTQYREI
ncbi:sugar MFS transporter [Mangrovibacterium marinum]|uniref:Fucose permease n=1 Tax=Mangrovibacterium marinum TaxID=1639118 RepID=A0A2T5C4T8_9BACT|nr:MFS transporter [Mangrovibacterium marinum]PTN09866.1 fucose permease [Mangrovibacterium marinum]